MILQASSVHIATIFQIIGLLGAFLILAAFAANKFRWIKSDSDTYDLMNVFGGFSMMTTGIYQSFWGVIILDSIWAIIALLSIIRRHSKKQRAAAQL